MFFRCFKFGLWLARYFCVARFYFKFTTSALNLSTHTNLTSNFKNRLQTLGALNLRYDSAPL
ncbi:hypothetical protein CSUNSWCD_860 [Campylobacter showae CSUNSWCD]|uniref:Uncharacterized protein n=1 Tax=Campylobacter showae CSUNSWCD TaxID=1244083 RepID=M5INS8_9BACT|nr:hypothetical protein CSUNSWCD_860 [Campylobacter showae CSUNSWCD]